MEINCDVYIDDAPHQLENFVKHVPEKLILRFVRPYNRPVSGTKDLKLDGIKLFTKSYNCKVVV